MRAGGSAKRRGHGEGRGGRFTALQLFGSRRDMRTCQLAFKRSRRR